MQIELWKKEVTRYIWIACSHISDVAKNAKSWRRALSLHSHIIYQLK